MKIQRIIALGMTAVMAAALAACSAAGPEKTMENEKMASMESAGKMGDGSPGENGEDRESMEDPNSKMEDMGAEEGMAGNTVLQSFPAFEGKDLDGNAVKSEELFGENAATVVNFWFTACGPCVGELSELEALNKELSEKGAALVGINVSTIGGDQAVIEDAKEVLAKKGATYRNVYFDEESEAGTFADGVYAFPTTYVVNRKGVLVGEPVVGALRDEKYLGMVRKLVDQAIAMEDGKGGGTDEAPGTT